MPKRPKEHTFDKIAKQYLKSVFPISWIFKNTEEDDSGKEYGQDCLVEIVDEQSNVTGAEFIIQNKVVTKPTSNDFIKDRIKVDTLEYLNGLSHPVMLYFFDATSKQGYWMWLEPYYAEHSHKWQTKKRVTVKIPREKILDSNAVVQIERDVVRFHQQHGLLKMTQAATAINPHFGFQYSQRDGSVTIGIYPKSQDAPPLDGTLYMQVADYARFNQALETGQPVEFSGRIKFPDLPNWFFNCDSEVDIKLTPLFEPFVTYVSLEILGPNDEVLKEFPFLELQRIRKTRRLDQLQATVPGEPILLDYVFEFSTESNSLTVSFNRDYSNSARAIHKYIEYLELIERSSKFKIKVLKTQKIIEIDAFPTINRNSTETKISQVEKLFFRALNTISLAFDTEILVPDSPSPISSQVLNLALEIEQILTTGRTRAFIEQMNLPESMILRGIVRNLEDARELLHYYDLNGEILVQPQNTSSSQFSAELLGYTFDLGEAMHHFPSHRILDIDGLREFLSDDSIPEDTAVYIVAQVDPKDAYTQFLNWPAEQD